MKFDFNIFFAKYREKFGDIRKSETVRNIETIIRAADKYGANINQLAYLLATAYHETGFDFMPKYEYGTQAYFIKRYWLNSRVARWLGNENRAEAFKYRGRGLVQITGKTNYEKFGITDNPDKAIEIETAVEILYKGCMGGMFTGKKLGDYIRDNSYDFYSARRVINGYDKAETISLYAERFLSILSKSIII